MDIISRDEWGARYDRGFGPAPLPAREVWLHHSVTAAPDLVPPFDDDAAAIRTLEEIGERRFGGGISYTFAVTPVGRVYEGHGVDREGAHTRVHNSVGRAIVLVGDYEATEPTDAQLHAVAALLRHGRGRGWWIASPLAGGHRDVPGASTECPGSHAYAAIPAINRLAQEDGTASSPPDQDRLRPTAGVTAGPRPGRRPASHAGEPRAGTRVRSLPTIYATIG